MIEYKVNKLDNVTMNVQVEIIETLEWKIRKFFGVIFLKLFAFSFGCDINIIYDSLEFEEEAE